MGSLGNHKIVMVSVKSYLDETLPSTPAPEITLPVVRHTADSEEKLAGALKDLKDGDVLVFHGHSNKQSFPIGKGTIIEWKKLWGKMKAHGIKTPPKLAMVFFASCMASKQKPNDGSWIYQPLSHAELKGLKSAFHARIAVAPHYEYASHTGWSPVGKDELVSKKAISDIMDYYTGKIAPGELLHRFQKKGVYDRFGVTFGCNGWNHPDGCSCGFGVRKLNK